MHKAKVKIGLVLARTPGYSETFLTNKIQGLVESGFEVITFVNKQMEPQLPFGKTVKAYSLPDNSLHRLVKTLLVFSFLLLRCPRKLYLLYKLLKDEKAPMYHVTRNLFRSAHILPYSVNWLHFGFSTLTIGRENVAQAIGARMSVSLRGYDICVFPLRSANAYSNLWDKVNKVHTISDDLHIEARKLGMPGSLPVVKIRPAIDVLSFVCADRRPVSRDSISILTIARLQWKKGLEVALDAMTVLKKAGVKFNYTIVGQGSDWERLHFARLQLGLEDEVEFVGRKDHELIPSIMKKHDVYIQPSLQEGFCNSVLEAQASGLLCIVTDAEGLSENVAWGETGWIVPRWDAQALADAIKNAWAVPENEQSKIRSKAIERIQREFNLELQKDQFQAFFSESGVGIRGMGCSL